METTQARHALETQIDDLAARILAERASDHTDHVLLAELDAQRDALVSQWVRASAAAGTLAA